MSEDYSFGGSYGTASVPFRLCERTEQQQYGYKIN